MTNSASLSVIIVFLFLLICQIGLGSLFVRFFESRDTRFKLSEVTILGILISLHLFLVLKNFGLDWLSALLLISMLGFINLFFDRGRLRLQDYKPSLNLVLWIFVISILGVSLFNYSNQEISTYWVNNYGDLTFHLGMISSFTFGENFPPEFHLYSASILSYPFLINLWTATVWNLFGDYQALAVIFTLQWIVLWMIIYSLLNADRNWILPWALLFGGGSFFFLGNNSGKLIPENKPWTLFLTTIWVTQRSTILGLAGGMAALSLAMRFLEFFREDPHKAPVFYLLTAGVLIGLSDIAHTHFALAFGIFIGLLLFTQLVQSEQIAWTLPKQLKSTRNLRIAFLLFILAGSLSCLPGLTYLLSKSGILEFKIGWLTAGTESMPVLQKLFLSSQIWIRDAWQIILAFLLFWFFSKKHFECFIILIMFFFFNFVHAAPWSWDQIKFFIPLTAILLYIWSVANFRFKYVLQIFLLLSIVPSLYELIPILSTQDKLVVFSNEEIQIATRIRKVTKPEAILAASVHTHKSPAVLTGRRQYAGYDGTLWSHGLKPQSRINILNDLDNLSLCKTIECPDYLVWTRDEKQKYDREFPGDKFQATASKNLYWIKK